MSQPYIIDPKKLKASGLPASLQVIMTQLVALANRPPVKGPAGRGIRSVTAHPVTGALTITFTDGVTAQTTRLTGRSAYEVAVANGYVGTQADWLASLSADVPALQAQIADLSARLAALEGGTPATAPAITAQPTILPGGAQIGDSITLGLGTASGHPAPTAAWALTRGGVDISAQVDQYLALELTAAGEYVLAVTWSNSAGTAVAANATLTVAAPPAAIDRKAVSYVDIDSTPTFAGSATAVTSLTADGSGARVFTVVGSGAAVQIDATHGVTFGSGQYLRNAGNTVANADGILVIARAHIGALTATDNLVSITGGVTLNLRYDGANDRPAYNFNAGANTNINGVATAGSAAELVALEIDKIAGTIRYWSGADLVTLTGQSITSALTFTTVDLGASLTGAVTDASVVIRPAGAAWPATMEQMLRAYGVTGGATTGPFDLTSLRVMPAIVQSEGRPKSGGYDLMAGDIRSNQAVYVAGLRSTAGAVLPPWGAGDGQIDQAVAGTGLVDAATAMAGRSSMSYALQYLWARRQDPALGRGVLIGDNGFGGLAIERYLLADPNYYADNQLYWMQEVDRLATAAGVTVACPFIFHWLGTSGKADPYTEWRDTCAAVWDWHSAQITSLFGGTPKVLVVQNGGDTNGANGDLCYPTQAEYDEVKARGGEILFPQYMLLIADDNIHPPTSELLIGGEMADWAVQAIEAGEPWTMWATITKAGTTVTVTFALRPGESLTDLADLYADYGGAATCPHFGFEAFGGIAAAVLDGAAGTVTLTLNSATATWLRFAMQRQDVSGPGTKDAAGLGYGAHRTTLRSTQTRPSQLYPGKTLRRCPPSFSGTFSGDVFSFGPT